MEIYINGWEWLNMFRKRHKMFSKLPIVARSSWPAGNCQKDLRKT